MYDADGQAAFFQAGFILIGCVYHRLPQRSPQCGAGRYHIIVAAAQVCLLVLGCLVQDAVWKHFCPGLHIPLTLLQALILSVGTGQGSEQARVWQRKSQKVKDPSQI